MLCGNYFLIFSTSESECIGDSDSPSLRNRGIYDSKIVAQPRFELLLFSRL